MLFKVKNLLSLLLVTQLASLPMPQRAGQALAASLAEESKLVQQPDSSFYLPRDPTRPRGIWLGPILSYVLPGADQFYEGQYTYALGYAGTAALGMGFALNNAQDLQIEEGVNPLSERSLRPYLWGTQLWSLSGSLSAYQGFRSAAISRQYQGEFGFLKRHDEISDVLMAPLDFGFLQRPTTYIPLLVAASINFLTLESVATDPDYERSSLDGGDLFYANALSFGAGVGEEALFRGWLLPALQHYTGNSMVSNGGAATLFALAHYPVVQRPVFQLIMGAYWGYLTQSNRWSIRESIFIHTWWDVMAFLTIYQIENKKLAKIPNIEQLTLRLPPLRFSF